MSELANTILKQIGANTLMCLGVPPNSRMAIPESTEHLGGVTFKFTNCPKVRNGQVFITLAGDDTYNVKIISDKRVLLDIKEVYNSMLSGSDGVIEGITG